MTDPRAANCRAYHLDAAGRVDGVLLEYQTLPDTPYALHRVALVSEAEAAGNTVATFAVYGADGLPVEERVYLAWPWPNLTSHILPGNPNHQHMLSNGFDAAGGVIGPLALYVGDAKGNPISDIVGGLGLPNNRHVCYTVDWRARGGQDDDGGDTGGDTGGGGTVDIAGLLAELQAFHADFRAFMARWGAAR